MVYKADITLSIDEHDKIKCWDGLWAWIDWEHLALKVDLREGNTGGGQGENTTPAKGATSNVEFEGSGGDSTQTNKTI